ncbi:PREDICTED: RING-H2 finger protein ATL63-like [Populus euphratica]|uniref:RING-type E3 ubiquitin transferase n=1 Tax=Populus euphratica TaxID=75702 RepID=A0AAJ6XND6_POPEU|nr:PREDICTED: RING-H2 finger protein ATL63-like [Populus euphratica]
MPSAIESPEHNPMSHLINNISSYDSNIMLAAVISLLLVILFVLLLHIYAKWFLAQARHRRRSSSVSVSHVLRASRFHHFHNFTVDTTFSTSPSKGLDGSVISSIPLFVYKAEECKQGLECVICLSPFEENEVGKSLIKCGHGFHVECIDMWLNSHSNCPVCRAPAVGDDNDIAIDDLKSTEVSRESTDERGLSDGGASRLEIVTDFSNSENENGNVVVDRDCLSESPSTSLSLSSSLKRMCRNRSESKVFPSINATALDA